MTIADSTTIPELEFINTYRARGYDPKKWFDAYYLAPGWLHIEYFKWCLVVIHPTHAWGVRRTLNVLGGHLLDLYCTLAGPLLALACLIYLLNH